MRILYVTASLPFGPGETFVVPEVEELLRRGHEVRVVPLWPRGGMVHEGARRLLPLTAAHHLASPRVLYSAALYAARRPIPVARALMAARASRTPAILAKNLIAFPKALWLAREAARWRAHHIHAHWISTTATLAMWAAEVSRTPWSVTTHRWDIGENNLLPRKAASACFVRAINLQGAERLRSLAGLPGFEPAVIHVGVRLPPDTARAQRPRSGPLRLLTAANLLPVKGHRYLLEALASLCADGVGVSLDLAGDGPLRPELERQARDLDIADKVRFLGQLPHGELLERMAAGEWDAAVLPSIVTDSGEHEGTPVSLMEAMACGLPAVSTLTGGIGELLDGGAGILVPQKDPRALADAIRQLAADPGYRAALAAAGQRRVREEFSIERVVDELERRFAACPHANRAPEASAGTQAPSGRRFG